MLDHIIVFLTAISIAYLITPTIRSVGIKLFLLDKRDDRKIHKKIVSRFGGMAIYLGFIVAILLSFLLEPGMETANIIKILHMILAFTLVLFLGIYDDSMGANAFTKFCVQILASLLVIRAGVIIDVLNIPFLSPIELGVLSVPLTVLWLVGITNAINLIDGLDGLAAGIVAINALTFSLIFWVSGQVFPGFFSLAIAGACIGFLPYNSYPAKIFMGDTGSLFLGFSIATLSIFTNCKSLATAGVLAPLLGLSVPIVDTLLAFIRRIARGNNPFRADKQHIHHWLLSKKLPDKIAVNILWGLTAAINVSMLLFFSFFRYK
jgi:UDP-GlcNAc:undecaprenyl-phosphate GlcNAc-1-phosphate transferase